MPPPPPPPPAPGPPRGLKLPTKSAGSNDRNALLSSIEKGKMLKKTVTNDRSAPIVGGDKINKNKPSANGAIQGPTGGGGGGFGGMVNGGAPQLGGLFAGGMPKLRPTGRAKNNSDTTDSGHTRLFVPGVIGGMAPPLPLGKKPSAPATPPASTKPTHNNNSPLYLNHTNDINHSNGSLPPSPKPSSKSSPAPPPPPSNRKPTMSDRGTGGRAPYLDIPPPSSKPAPPRPSAEFNSSNQNDERHPPLPVKPLKIRPEPGYRGAPPRPPSSSKPFPLPKSPDLKPDGELRRTSIDRSISLREPFRPPVTQTRVGTSAESPAAPFRVNTNHREAPPIPSSRPPLSKTVGRAAGNKLMPGLRPPSEKPPKPPLRPVVAAPPPPSQPPPPPPSHRLGTTPTLIPGGKADVPLPPIPQNSVPPPPPERNESTRTTHNKQPGDFECKFSNLFKSRHQFPLPLTYNNVPKIYPSKNNGKSQRRAPLPPTSSSSQQQHPTNNPSSFTSNSSYSLTLNSSKSSPHGYNVPTTFPHIVIGGNPPPPPPPHAPLHLQMDRKFYGTEASHC